MGSEATCFSHEMYANLLLPMGTRDSQRWLQRKLMTPKIQRSGNRQLLLLMHLCIHPWTFHRIRTFQSPVIRIQQVLGTSPKKITMFSGWRNCGNAMLSWQWFSCSRQGNLLRKDLQIEHLRFVDVELTSVKPLRPSFAWIFLKPSPRELAKVGSACTTRQILDMRNKNAKLQPALKITYLSSALDNIKRTDDSVGQTTCEYTSYHALLVVGHIMYVTHISALFM